MERDVILAVGIILFVAGVIMFFVFNPSYTSLSNRLTGYDTPSLEETEYEHYTLLNSTVMPIINLLIAIGVTMLLLGVLTREKK